MDRRNDRAGAYSLRNLLRASGSPAFTPGGVAAIREGVLQVCADHLVQA
jgi:hypothetical protein